MRYWIFVAALALGAAPAFAQSQAPSQSQAPGPATSYQRHEASEHFSQAGQSAAQSARETGRALEHGWQATKQGVTTGWNKATGDNDTK